LGFYRLINKAPRKRSLGYCRFKRIEKGYDKEGKQTVYPTAKLENAEKVEK